jgi:hypothetical protein
MLHYSKQQILKGNPFMIPNHRPTLLATLLALVVASITWTCSEKIDLPLIENNIARPVSITSDDKGEFFYILNANLKNTYENGSILVVNRQGTKRLAYATERLGRNIFLSGSDLLVTYDRDADPNGKSLVELYEVSTPAGEMPKLSLKQSWKFASCNPINGIISNKIIAVACQTGKLLLGDLADDRSDSTLDEFRNYPSFARRALYIDPAKNILYAFVSDWGEPTLVNKRYTDAQSWDASKDKMVSGANDVPDALENSKAARQKLANLGSAYTFAVIDLDKAKADQQDGHYVAKTYDEVAKTEMRWLYYNLTHSNGDADISDLADDEHYYQTNFWAAHPDSKDPNIFYLSQRGKDDSDAGTYANNIVKVTLNKDATREDILNLSKPTAALFTFDRVFGQKNTPQTDGKRYLSDFALTEIDGRPSLVVNSFRSLGVNPDENYYMYTAPLDPSQAATKTQVLYSDDSTESYFAFALAPASGDLPPRLAVSSFYGDTLYLYNIGKDLSFDYIKSIP